MMKNWIAFLVVWSILVVVIAGYLAKKPAAFTSNIPSNQPQRAYR